MYKYFNLFIITAFMALTLSCAKEAQAENNEMPVENSSKNTNMDNPTTKEDVKVLVKTTAGDFTVLLYGDTPKHQENFIKLVNEKYYDGTLFHRVIKDFMVQGGDPDSKTASKGQMLGSGGPGYQIDAEILYPKHFHKRYALAAARQGDQVNPEKKSSGSQFYVVTGQTLKENQLGQLEKQMQQQKVQEEFNKLAMAQRDRIMEMRRNRDQAGLMQLQETLIQQAQKAAEGDSVKLTPEMKSAYTTIGGAPHLDNAYTVFGEVIKGQDVIDRIEGVGTDSHDRPLEDVRIISMEIEK